MRGERGDEVAASLLSAIEGDQPTLSSPKSALESSREFRRRCQCTRRHMDSRISPWWCEVPHRRAHLWFTSISSARKTGSKKVRTRQAAGRHLLCSLMVKVPTALTPLHTENLRDLQRRLHPPCAAKTPLIPCSSPCLDPRPRDTGRNGFHMPQEPSDRGVDVAKKTMGREKRAGNSRSSKI